MLQLRWLLISVCLVKLSSTASTFTFKLNGEDVQVVSKNQSIHNDKIRSDNQFANNQSDISNSTNSSGSSSSGSSSTLSSSSKLKYVNKIDLSKRKFEKKSILLPPVDMGDWKCPNITQNRNLECGCDMPHTLRCSGDVHGLELIADGLRSSPYTVSLLDCTLKNVTVLSDANIFENVSLQGLVISSGEIKRVHRSAFIGIKTPLQALGLPNNALTSIPMPSLSPLTMLDRLDLSNNQIKALQNTDFVALQKLTYLELSENSISYISQKTFTPLKNLMHLKLNGNRLGDMPASFRTLQNCLNLRELDLRSNSIRGPLKNSTLPTIKGLESLNLDKNLISSIQNGALEGFSYLEILSLRHNQIDVLQDHAFSGLSSLQVLDLGHNGIVAVSGSSLKHLPKLIVLDLTHNFLRALTADIILPLPSLKELRLDGNDISIVAKNALYNASELHSLSLQENPLACDCTLKPFAEWLSSSRISSQDLLGAVCATPPHLEGAPLLQIPVESLNCDNLNKEMEKSNVFRTIEAILKHKNNMSYIKDVSGDVRIQTVNITDENDINLTWKLITDDYSCRFIYIFNDDDTENIVFHSEIQCIASPMENSSEFIFSSKASSVYELEREKRYKFCLVMKEDVSKDEFLAACSSSYLTLPSTNSTSAKPYRKEMITTRQANESDVADVDNVADDEDTSLDDEIYSKQLKYSEDQNNVMKLNQTPLSEQKMSYTVLSSLGIVIIISSLLAFIWGFIKLKNDRTDIPSVTTCYTVDDRRSANHEVENRNRYFKLQATTSL